ncbi:MULTISPECIES: helicase HerA domain-containing protein [unclassified Streptomyces]|uniref:ATP-binding protein n=1 Tax=unclassified Streptomyces TaxID=2593676 RepID=UPI0036E8D3FE
MSRLSGIAGAATAGGNPLTALLDGAKRLGGIYHLDYDKAIVITDDFVKREAGGIPRNGFLLAAATVPTKETNAPLDEDEVILLRVRGTAALPNESELIATRLAAMRTADVRDQRPEAVIDNLTSSQIEMSAFDCEVIGTFYADSVARQPYVQWGADIDNVYSGARYFVYLPSAEVLSFIASYPDKTPDEIENREQPDLIDIGVVRFASTRRRAVAAKMDTVPVKVRVTDFIARKTAVLGMTRVGKSNTNKTLCTAVFEHAARTGREIGQLIFDPQGEYANVNEQDKTGLRLLGIGSDRVRIYKMMPDPNDDQEFPLAVNFHDTNEFPMVWEILGDSLADMNASYANAFKTARLLEPDRDDYPIGTAGDREYYDVLGDVQRGKLAFYALLAKAGYSGTAHGFSLRFKMDKQTRAAFESDRPGIIDLVSPNTGLCAVRSPAEAKTVVTWLSERITEVVNDNVPPQYQRVNATTWQSCDPFMAVLAVFDGKVGSAVINRIRTLVDFHDPRSRGDLADKVWDDLVAGRLVIVDLSVGSDKVTTILSERLVFRLIDRANQRFRANQPNVPIQIVVEEAHNLFDRSKSGKSTVKDDPWVRLAKEAAKYEMGLVYATQEVTSVDKRILSNTSNWIVAHLNSDNETRELSHYYDFAVFAEGLRKVEDRGYARMKTFSGKYIVPVQIAKFDHAMINRAREAAGLSPINP